MFFFRLRFFCDFKAAVLTEGVVQLFDGEGEATVSAVEAEEDHGDVLRGAAGGSCCRGGAVVCVALVERQLVVLLAGELLSLQDPAIKHLSEGNHLSHCNKY